MLTNAPITAVLPTTDLARARAFYEGKLGLHPESESAVEQGVLYKCGGNTHLYVYLRSEPNKAEHTQAMFEVEDIEKAVSDLSEKGVMFEHYDLPYIKTDARGIAELEGEKSAWFKDPDGNIIAIGQAAEKSREVGL